MILHYENWCDLPTIYGNFRMYDLQDEDVRLLSYGPIEEAAIFRQYVRLGSLV